MGQGDLGVFLIFLPFLAAIVYLVARGDGMRAFGRAGRRRTPSTPTYDRRPARAPTSWRKLSELRDKGAISDEEFQRAGTSS